MFSRRGGQRPDASFKVIRHGTGPADAGPEAPVEEMPEATSVARLVGNAMLRWVTPGGEGGGTAMQ